MISRYCDTALRRISRLSLGNRGRPALSLLLVMLLPGMARRSASNVRIEDLVCRSHRKKHTALQGASFSEYQK